MANETRQLAEFIVEMRDRELPEDLRDRMRSLTLDNLAAGYLGSRQSCFQISTNVVSALGGRGDSRVFGLTGDFDLSRAALLNGIAIGAFECDHTTFGAHAGGAVFPAALALGASLHVSGELFIRALICGYEVNARVAAAQTNLAEQIRGFHNPGISGTFASAAACAVLLDLPVDQVLSALGIAGSHSAGLIEYVWTGAMTKRLHEGRATQLGLESALLARAGFTGPPTIFEGEYGYLHAFSPEPIAAKLVDGLGSGWVFEETRVKPFPGHGTAQPFAPVLDAWRSKGVDPRRIDAIHITTSEQGTEARFQEVAPDSVLGAQYSVPFMTAVAIARGTDGLIELNEGVIDDDLLRELASKVTISAEEHYKGNVIAAGGEIAIDIDGEREILTAPGIAKLSLPELRVLCEQKLERYARDVVEASAVSRSTVSIGKLESVTDLAEIGEEIFPR
jgi:2-methylcitrate dehydratase PrpD